MRSSTIRCSMPWPRDVKIPTRRFFFQIYDSKWVYLTGYQESDNVSSKEALEILQLVKDTFEGYGYRFTAQAASSAKNMVINIRWYFSNSVDDLDAALAETKSVVKAQVHRAFPQKQLAV
jgi:hypothetical protein